MKKLFLMLFSLLLCFSFTGCSLFTIHTGSEDTGEEPLSGTVTVGLEENLSGRNLLFSGGEKGDALLRQLLHGYSTVSQNENGSYSYNKDVVEKMSWVEEPDGSRTYIFEIKKDLLFSDGTPVTAKDYVFGILLQSSSTYKVLGGDIDKYQMVVGYRDYLTGQSDVFTGVNLLSEYRFSLKIASEDLPYFYEYLALEAKPYPMHAMAPEATINVSKDGALIENLSRSGFRTVLTGKESYNSAPLVTSGPFTFVSYLEDSETVVLTANEQYQLADKASAKVLVVKGGVEDLQAELTSGLVDVAYDISGMDTVKALQALQLKGEASAYETISDEYYYLSFDVDTGITADLAVRQAAAYAIDDLSMAVAVTGSGEGVLNCFAHPESSLALANAEDLGKNFGYGHSLLLAKELLQGYENPTVVLSYDKADEKAADLTREYLTEAGFTVLSRTPEGDETCGVITLKRGVFTPGMDAYDGGDPLVLQKMTELASTQTEYYNTYWMEYQTSLRESLHSYPLFSKINYTFYSSAAEFRFPESEREGFYGLSSVFTK